MEIHLIFRNYLVNELQKSNLYYYSKNFEFFFLNKGLVISLYVNVAIPGQFSVEDFIKQGINFFFNKKFLASNKSFSRPISNHLQSDLNTDTFY